MPNIRVASKSRRSCDGYVFGSLAEKERYQQLKLIEQSGEIHNLTVHPSYLLQESFYLTNGKKVLPIKYVADFSYWEHGRIIVEEVKGFETDVWKIKKKMFLNRYPNCGLRIIKI